MQTHLFSKILIGFLLLLFCVPTVKAGEACCHILNCCRSNNDGMTFLLDGKWNPAHNYRDINQVSDGSGDFTIPSIGLAKPDVVGDKKTQRIDTHIHLYDTRREGSAIFLDPVKHSKIYFPHFSKQFSDVAKPAGVDFAIVVEASQRREDNFWLMNKVDSSDVLLAFIANLDPRDSWYENDLESLSKSKKFRGIRIRTSKPINLADPQIVDKLSELEDRNLVLDLGVNYAEPAIVSAIARRYPKMNIIINHLAGGKIFNDPVRQEEWKARLSLYAAEPNVYCKVSGLFDASNQTSAPLNPDFYEVLIDPVVAAFGPERVMFGSNWTLSDMYGTYGNMIRMLNEYCRGRVNLLPEKFWFENAKKAYGLRDTDN